MSRGMSRDIYDYLVNNSHRVKIDLEKGIIITPRGTNGNICSSTGYLRAKVGRKSIQVHQLLSVKYFGERCIGKQINHKNGNKLDNTITNLEVVTQLANIQHQKDNGLMNVTKKPVCKLDMEGNVLETFESVVEAARSVNGGAREVSKAIAGYSIKKGRRDRVLSYKGYKWRSLL